MQKKKKSEDFAHLEQDITSLVLSESCEKNSSISIFFS